MGHTASLCFNPDLKSEIAAPSRREDKSGSGEQNVHRLVGVAAEKSLEKGRGKIKRENNNPPV